MTRHDALVPDDVQPGSRVMDISVLTPSYEYGRLIADGIESVIQQPDLRLQHIIQDAGSGDETLEVVRSFGDRVEWASEIDLGQSDGLNGALAKATGDWIAQLNADEYCLPDGLRVLVEEGEKHSADVVYGDCVTLDREGRVIGLRPQHPFSRLILRLYEPFPEMVTQGRENAICDTQLAAGSYRRQLRARSFKGLDLRWFRERNDVDTFCLLLDRCYRIRTNPERVRSQGAR
jgi:glycosyltransferase involved in cell wall biosynthesis